MVDFKLLHYAGLWPKMKHETLRNIARELADGRANHPTNLHTIAAFKAISAEFETTLNSYQLGGSTALAVYCVGLQMAALAIRLIEEGDGNFNYGSRMTYAEHITACLDTAERGERDLERFMVDRSENLDSLFERISAATGAKPDETEEP